MTSIKKIKTKNYNNDEYRKLPFHIFQTNYIQVYKFVPTIIIFEISPRLVIR